MRCIRYRYISHFGGVIDMPEIQIHDINKQGIRYTRDIGIFLLFP